MFNNNKNVATMKKTYINPDVKVVKINAHRLLAGSDMGMNGNYDSGTITIGGRDFDFDDEE